MEDDRDWIGLFEEIGVTLGRALIATHLVAILIGFVMGALMS